MCRQMKDDLQHVEELPEGIPRKQNPTGMGMLEDQISSAISMSDMSNQITGG